MTGGIARLAAGIADELRLRLPRQRGTQRDKLALLVAMMLDVRCATVTGTQGEHGQAAA